MRVNENIFGFELQTHLLVLFCIGTKSESRKSARMHAQTISPTIFLRFCKAIQYQSALDINVEKVESRDRKKTRQKQQKLSEKCEISMELKGLRNFDKIVCGRKREIFKQEVLPKNPMVALSGHYVTVSC